MHSADWGGWEGRRDVPRHACDRGCPAAPSVGDPIGQADLNTMTGTRAVAALVLCAARAMTTNAT